MTITKKIPIILLSSWLLTACSQGVLYSEFTEVSPLGWNKDSAVSFVYNIQDTISACDVLLHVRHHDNYPYQNMWLFLSSTNPKGQITKDTIEFFLADERGRWLGNGKNGLVTMPVLYEHNYHFTDTGTYILSIRQGMRTDLLRGVSQVGLEICKP